MRKLIQVVKAVCARNGHGRLTPDALRQDGADELRACELARKRALAITMLGDRHMLAPRSTLKWTHPAVEVPNLAARRSA